ncbi:conserved hypothetical protein [Paecilomyces variotii No. 5]|uniref:Uncharacterized protein n=1 Tax=Byssochlamys spectabilis (strain No. 5 / NBRC 109023) TaxID=1356009 RepID=V5G6G6_BYSSN|nr:conserved hypothetical protein [Paecilomyces variotii No. 5]
MAANLAHTISVVDKSGKVVSTSKHLFGVFKEARDAYRERKAEIRAERNAIIAEKQALKALEACHIDEERSIAASRRSGRSKRSHHPPRSQHHRSHVEREVYGHPSYDASYAQPGDLQRRYSDQNVGVNQSRPVAGRYNSDSHIDMDLAYGEAHPSALALAPRDLPPPEEQELNGLVDRAKMLLEEADCVQRSATATMAHLQKHPDAMAAVALTLAEISNIAAKMAPGVLSSLKASAPGVFALLASPQFLIAAGVGIGVTIVMFGGYKIIKRIQGATESAGADMPKGQQAYPEPMDQMFELNEENLSRVEVWRRGVADVEASSVGTSVDGEFITPTAAAMSGIDVTLAGMSRDPRFKYEDDISMASSHRSRRSHRSKAHSSAAPSRAHSKAPSKAPSRAPSKAPSKAHSKVSEKEKKPKEKPKRSSRLKLMFTA